MQTARGLDPSFPHLLSLLGQTYALAGLPQEALRALAELEEMGKRRYLDPILFARVWVALGDKEAAFAHLEAAYAARSEELCYLKLDPHFDGLRADPRFADLLRRVGLEP